MSIIDILNGLPCILIRKSIKYLVVAVSCSIYNNNAYTRIDIFCRFCFPYSIKKKMFFHNEFDQQNKQIALKLIKLESMAIEYISDIYKNKGLFH